MCLKIPFKKNIPRCILANGGGTIPKVTLSATSFLTFYAIFPVSDFYFSGKNVIQPAARFPPVTDWQFLPLLWDPPVVEVPDCGDRQNLCLQELCDP